MLYRLSQPGVPPIMLISFVNAYLLPIANSKKALTTKVSVLGPGTETMERIVKN